MKRKARKGFTIIELVIVIGVIGILSAILIPTFSNLVKQSQFASDQSGVRNMNTVLEMKKAEGSMDKLTLNDAYDALKNGGFDLGTIKPASSGMVFGFNADTTEVGLFNENNKELVYSTTMNSGVECDNVALINGEKIDLYLTSNYDFTSSTRKNLNIYSSETINVTIDGTIIGNVNIDAENATITQNGIIDGDGYGSYETVFDKGILTIESASSVSINGYVDQLNVGTSNITISSSGVIRNIKEATELTLVNNGWVNYVEASSGITSTNNGYYNGTAVANYEYQTEFDIEKPEDLLKLSAKTQRATLPYFSTNTSSGTASMCITMNLVNDIDISKMTYIPLATYLNKNGGSGPSKGLRIDLLGNNHSIKGLRQNFLGSIGAGSSFDNLTLVFDYEAEDDCVCGDNIFYKSASQDGNIQAWYVKATDPNYYMHVGCLANSIVNMTSTPIIVNNLSVDGKLILKNVEHKVWYCVAVVAGEYNGASGQTAIDIRNLSLSNTFILDFITDQNGHTYADSGYYNKPALYTGDFGTAGAKVRVTYNDKTETGTPRNESSIYSGWGTMMTGGTLLNS